MGKFKTLFVACLGLGIAAGAGYYLYKKFLSKNGEEENNSSTQQAAESEDVTEKRQEGQEDSNDDNKEVPKTEPDADSSVKDKQAKPTANQQRKKSNFGGLKRGFLL